MIGTSVITITRSELSALCDSALYAIRYDRYARWQAIADKFNKAVDDWKWYPHWKDRWVRLWRVGSFKIPERIESKTYRGMDYSEPTFTDEQKWTLRNFVRDIHGFAPSPDSRWWEREECVQKLQLMADAAFEPGMLQLSVNDHYSLVSRKDMTVRPKGELPARNLARKAA